MATVPTSYWDPSRWFMDTDHHAFSDFWPFKFFLSLNTESRAHLLQRASYSPQRIPRLGLLGLYPVLHCREFVALTPVSTEDKKQTIYSHSPGTGWWKTIKTKWKTGFYLEERIFTWVMKSIGERLSNSMYMVSKESAEWQKRSSLQCRNPANITLPSWSRLISWIVMKLSRSILRAWCYFFLQKNASSESSPQETSDEHIRWFQIREHTIK